MTYIIAEAGVNHNGSTAQALKLIDAAADAGADAVKFQTFRADTLVVREAGKAAYQRNTTDADETQYAMLKRLELDENAHHKLMQHCTARGIQFLSTPFDIDSLTFLHQTLQVPVFKVSSGDITNAPLLFAIARTQKPVIVSTGMSTLGDIESALSVLAFGYTCSDSDSPSIAAFARAYGSESGRQALQDKVKLLHCTTEYPAPIEDVNLRVMDTLRSAFGLSVGFSDHTEGITVSIAAAARQAAVVEKHFTLNRQLPGPDHKASLEPHELAEMVRAIRIVEKALGSSRKVVVPSEQKNLTIARKGLVAARRITKGEVFSEENMTVKRPAVGAPPLLFWEKIGRISERDYDKDQPIDSVWR